MGQQNLGTTPPPAPVPANVGGEAGVSETMGADALSKPTETVNESRSSFEKFVPEDFKTKQWYTDTVKTDDPKIEFFKRFEHSQSLIGRKPEGLQVPTEASTPEQMQEWRKAIGVPETVDAYKIEPAQWADDDKPFADLMAQHRVTEVDTALKKVAFEQGLTVKQYEALAKTYDQEMVKDIKTKVGGKIELLKANDTAFDNAGKAKYGDKWDGVLATGKQLLEGTDITVDEKEAMRTAPPALLNLFTRRLYEVNNKHVREDTFNVGNGGNSNMESFASAGDVSAQAQKLMALPAFRDKRHVDHKKTVERVNALYESNRGLIEKSKK